MSSKGGSQSQSGSGAGGGQAEVAAEDEEPSSSSSSSSSSCSASKSTVAEDQLESFRLQWRRQVVTSKSSGENNGNVLENDESESLESGVEKRARELFLEGVSHEQSGELFEAIQKYRKAVLLVPDIEIRAFRFTHNMRRRDEDNSEATENELNSDNDDDNDDDDDDDDNGDSEDDVSDSELPEDEEFDQQEQSQDLLNKFAKMTVKNESLCSPNTHTKDAHISCLAIEVLIHILKWVVSTELDLRSLENFAQVCRGFYMASRSSDIWRLVCVQTWGVAALPLQEPSNNGGWRGLFLSRPRVQLNGCYISRVTYLREGERGFQDNEFYKAWHVVHYYRLIRFLAGGRLLMLTTAEEPANAVKLLTTRNIGCMFGHYKTVNNRVIGVVQKAKEKTTSSTQNSRFRRHNRNQYAFDVPEQDFHFELEINGKRHQQLQWLCYSVITRHKSGREQVSDIDVTNPNNYPTLYFSRVKSYTAETMQPLA